MASSRDFLEFVLEQLSELPDVTYRAMMGEFIIYYHNTVVGGIYDNRFLVKPTESVRKILPNASMEIPYNGGKPMMLLDDIENPELLKCALNAVYDDLSKSKK